MDPQLTASDFMLALCLFREFRGETMAAKAAGLAVIRNRVAASPRNGWPRTTTGVILQRDQFSSFNSSDPNVNVFPDSASPGSWGAWVDCCNVVTTPLTADPTGGANVYEATPDGMTRPSWAHPANFTVQIGKTRFYKI